MEFVSIDVETANSDMASICQIGIASYSGKTIVDEWVTLIDPQEDFDEINIGIHGIEEGAVQGQPKFVEAAFEIRGYLEGKFVVSHTHFDRISINKAFLKNNLESLNAIWIDSAMVARRTWPEFARKGYGLESVCEKIGYSFKHHDALEDAKAAGAIMLEAMRITKLDLTTWQKRVRQPIYPAINQGGNPEGRLYGEVVVFTGSLSIPRNEASELAVNLGCDVAKAVSKKTTLLVVGERDSGKWGGKAKSSKQIKAENFISKGQGIKIIKESDFKEFFVTENTDASGN